MITTGKAFFQTLNIYLLQAQKEILLSTFKIDLAQGSEYKPLKKTISLLTKQAQKGVKVKLICPGPPQKRAIAQQNFAAIRHLTMAGVDFRGVSGYATLHAKLCIIDRRILAIGSHNLAKGACSKNWEMSLFTIEEHLVSDATYYFLGIWDKMKS